MSRYNAPDYNNMNEENYLINATAVKVSEPCSVRISNQRQELMKQQKAAVGGSSTLDCEKQDVYHIGGRDHDMLDFSSVGPNKRCRRSVDGGVGLGALMSFQEQFDTAGLYGSDINGSTSHIPYHNIRTVNYCQPFADQYRDIISANNSKLVTIPIVSQDTSNIPSNSTTYSTNGTQINKIKNANSSGSSYSLQPHPKSLTSLSQVVNTTDANELRNQYMYMKSQNIAFSQKVSDSNMRKSNDDSMKGIVNPKKTSYVGDGNLNFAEYINPAFGSSNNVISPNVGSRKTSGLALQPEYYEGDVCIGSENPGDLNPNPGNQDSKDGNTSSIANKEEALTPTDFLYSNKFYLPTINVNEARNAISYIGQAIPVVVLNSNVDGSNLNLNSFPKFCLTQLLQHSIDPVNTSHSNASDKQIEGPDSYLRFQSGIIDGAKLYCPQIFNGGQQKPHQFSSNNELSRGNSFPMTVDDTGLNVMSNDEGLPSAESTSDVLPPEEDIPRQITDASPRANNVATIGKFTITTAKSTLKSIENTQEKYMGEEDLNMNTNSGSQQPRSRFKKTRIRETIERWCVNGLNTYDCRFKVIPSKIMHLRNMNLDILSVPFQSMSRRSYDDKDNEHRCHSTEYNNKEFRFWDYGDRIAICGKSDFDTENYCQFHAKYANLLNQNQNLSLSKFVPLCLNIPSSTSGSASSPQIIRAVLISSPDNENYTMNIDTNLSQNVALSAPPVSPSIMTSVPVSRMPFNLHSPQPAASMVMLRCQTPVILSSATRTATLMHESISIERINHKSVSKMGVESDNGGISGQPMFVTDTDAFLEMWPNYSLKPDALAFKVSSPTDAVFPGDEQIFNGPPSLYSVGPIPHILYSIQQPQIIPVPPGTTSKLSIDRILSFPNRNDYIISDPVSLTTMHEIDNNLSSLKSLIQTLVQSEQQPLINEIKLLVHANKNLTKELCEVKHRSDYLEGVLRDNQIPLEIGTPSVNISLPDLSTNSQHQIGFCQDLDQSLSPFDT